MFTTAEFHPSPCIVKHGQVKADEYFVHFFNPMGGSGLQITSQKQFPQLPCVYAITGLDKDFILSPGCPIYYIGATKNLKQRFAQTHHAIEKIDAFIDLLENYGAKFPDDPYYLYAFFCPFISNDAFFDIEAYLINHYRPLFNLDIPEIPYSDPFAENCEKDDFLCSFSSFLVNLINREVKKE